MKKLDSPFLALKMQGVGPTRQGLQADSRSWKRQGNGFSFRLSRQECSPANTLILSQGAPPQTSNLQNCKIKQLHCFEATKSEIICYGSNGNLVKAPVTD